jgi:hypothetical protein
VNRQLDKMGYNIGMRLIEDFLAKSNTGACANFKETAEAISKVGYHLLCWRVIHMLITAMIGWLQDISQHHTDCNKLDE